MMEQFGSLHITHLMYKFHDYFYSNLFPFLIITFSLVAHALKDCVGQFIYVLIVSKQYGLWHTFISLYAV